MSVQGKIRWDKFRLDGKAKWRDVKSAALEVYDNTELGRCVYILRLGGPFAIQYVNRASPTLYIGRGKIQQRVTSPIPATRGIRRVR